MASEQLFFDGASPQATLLVGIVYVLLLAAGTLAAVGLIARSFTLRTDWNCRVDWLRTRPWTWREGLLIAAIVGFMISLFMGVAILLKHPREATLVVLQSVMLDLVGIVSIAVLVRSRGWSWSRAFGMEGNPLRHLKTGLVFYLALLPFLLFSALIYQGILSVNGYPPSLQDIALLLSGQHPLWLRLYMVFLAVFAAPFFEECLFRGVLLPLLVRRLGLGAGIFLSSLAFAAIHFHLPSLIPLLIVACGFSCAYLYSRSLWVSIIMHGVFNGVNLAMLLVMRH